MMPATYDGSLSDCMILGMPSMPNKLKRPSIVSSANLVFCGCRTVKPVNMSTTTQTTVCPSGVGSKLVRKSIWMWSHGAAAFFERNSW